MTREIPPARYQGAISPTGQLSAYLAIHDYRIACITGGMGAIISNKAESKSRLSACPFGFLSAESVTSQRNFLFLALGCTTSNPRQLEITWHLGKPGWVEQAANVILALA
jgi:hypothetical protein